MRPDFVLLTSSIALALFASNSFAQGEDVKAYPQRPVKVVAPVAPGGIVDIHARLFSQKFSETLGQSFIVENRAGGGSLIGYQYVIKSAPDGYTLVYTSSTITILAAIPEKPEYDPVADFSAVSQFTKGSYMIVVTPSLPVKSMTELIAYARAKPGAVNWGLTGLGTSHHLGAAWIMNSAKIKMVLVPYKGGGPMQVDLLSGQVQAAFTTLVSAMPHVKSGKLRVVGVTSNQRFRVLPDVPTVAESGIPDFNFATWNGMFAPKGTPDSTLRRLHEAVTKFIRSPDVVVKMAADGLEPVASTPEEFRDYVAAEVPRWRKLVKDTGISMQD